MVSSLNKIILLVLGCIVISCTSEVKKISKESLIDPKTKDTTISFSGLWITTDYVESLKKFGSPKKAQDNSQVLFIPNKTLLPAYMILNFHEGGSGLTVIKGKNYELWEMQDDSLLQRYGNIKVIDENNILIGDRAFVKIDPKINEDDQEMIVEELLFKGVYKDSLGNKVEFKNDGTVQGLDSFSIYKPIVDYIGPGMNVDQIGLGTNDKDIKYFGFKFRNDTLEVYNLNWVIPDAEVEFGQLKFKLSKVNK